MQINRSKISLVIVVRNEAKNLQKCLFSCQQYVDEIIIVHDGNIKDETIKIAALFNARIIVRKLAGLPELHRATSFQQARNNWILQLDADESLSNEVAQNLQQLTMLDADIYEFIWPVKYKSGYYLNFYKRFLFRKNKISYVGLPHENVRPKDSTVRIKKANFLVYHEPKTDITNVSNFLKKYSHCAHVQAELMHKPVRSLSNYNYQNDSYPTDIQILIDYPYLCFILVPIYLQLKAFKILFNNIRKFNFYTLLIYPLSYTLYYWYVLILFLRKTKA